MDSEAKIILTVICHDCTPEQAAERIRQMPNPSHWAVSGYGEYEIAGAQVVRSPGSSGS
jgi:hypothetical protein